jgi:hypothetical protein
VGVEFDGETRQVLLRERLRGQEQGKRIGSTPRCLYSRSSFADIILPLHLPGTSLIRFSICLEEIGIYWTGKRAQSRLTVARSSRFGPSLKDIS